jgi:VWFA-related protein
MSAHLRLRYGAVPVLLLLAWTFAPSATAQGTQAGDRVVLAAVVDGSGKPVKDLAKADWVVNEDGTGRTLVDAKSATDPMEIILVVDTTKGSQTYVPDIRSGLLAFVQAIRAGSPDSEIALMTFGGQSMLLVDFKKPPTDVDKAIQKLYPNASSGSVMLEALVDASKKLAKTTSPRRVIVSLNLEGSSESSQLLPQNVVNAVQATGTSLWAVSFRNPEASDLIGGSNGSQTREQVLSGLTGGTGGVQRTVNVSSAIPVQLRQIADTLLSQYVVTYTRPDGPAPRLLQVVVNRPGVQVLASKVPPGAALSTKSTMTAADIAKHNKRQTELDQMFKDASAAVDAGNFDAALESLTAIANEMPNCAACYSKMGEVYVGKKDFDNAEKSLLKSAAIDPSKADVYDALANIYNQQKKFDDAAKMSAKATDLRGVAGATDPAAVFNQGVIFWNQSKIPEAQAQFAKAIQLDPKMADAHYWFAMTLVNANKLADAKKDFEEYLKLAPTGQYADTAKAILASIKI